MEGIATLIILCFSITFGPPIIFLIVGFVKRIQKKRSAKVFLILGTVWLIIGGGICFSILSA